MNRIRAEILQRVEQPEGKCWATSNGGETRLDLRFDEERRCSIQYYSLQKIEFYKEGSDSGEDLILLELGGGSRFEILGKSLLPIYDALNRNAARFIAASSDLTPDTDGVLVTAIREFSDEESSENTESVSDRDDQVQEFLESLEEGEREAFWEDAYEEARQEGNYLVDDDGDEGDQARWEAVSKKYFSEN